MTEQPKQKVEVESVDFTNLHAYLFHAVEWALRRAKKARWGGTRRSACLTVGVYCAFTLEAYLNYLGSKLYGKDWELWEMGAKPEAKLALVCRQIVARLDSADIDLEVAPDFGKRPFQTMKELFKLRNQLAHGKVIERKKRATQLLAPGEPPRAETWEDWQAQYTVEKAKRWKKDTKAICSFLHFAYQRPHLDSDDSKALRRKKVDPFSFLGVGSTYIAPSPGKASPN